jgi:hypothetical protein
MEDVLGEVNSACVLSLNERKDRQIMYNNEQEKSTQSWEKQTASQDHAARPDTLEISEEALENITGGMNPSSSTTIPNAYEYQGKKTQNRRMLEARAVTLITNDPSLPLHAEVMRKQYNGTVWQHAAFQRPDGQTEHRYNQVNL